MAPGPRHRPVHRLKARPQRVSVGTGASINEIVGAACCHGALPHAAPAEPFFPVHLRPCARRLLRNNGLLGYDALLSRGYLGFRTQPVRGLQGDPDGSMRGSLRTTKELQQTLVTSRHSKTRPAFTKKTKKHSPACAPNGPRMTCKRLLSKSSTGQTFLDTSSSRTNDFLKNESD